MDPQRAWLMLMEAIRIADYDEAVGIASDLYEWLSRGGFPPCIVPELSLGCRDPLSVPNKLQHEMALKACEFVLSMA